jgi:hypothetical protein
MWWVARLALFLRATFRILVVVRIMIIRITEAITMQFFCVLIMLVVRLCGGRRVRMRGLVMGVGVGKRGGMGRRYGWRG